MKKLLLLSTGMIFAAGFACAATTADQLVSAYQADGYTTIEVTTGTGQIKVEAVRDTTKVEVVYDAASGAILRQEQSSVPASEAGQGVEMKSAKRDFVKGAGKAEDDGMSETEDKSGDGSGSGSEGGDDHGGSHGSDDGGDHESGHDSGHDSGGDHSGSGGGSDD